jgi:glycine cleavage system regulatory protein
MPTSLVLTVLGEDRPGLVEALSHIIAAHQGNWLESRMAHLAGQFAGILRASVPEANAAALRTALQGLASRGLQVVIAHSSTDAPAPVARWLMLDLVGNDHPGIIRDLALTLAQRGINIDELQTACTSAPMTGAMLFKATARLRVPREVAIADLRTALEQLAHDLVVDITLEGLPVSL